MVELVEVLKIEPEEGIPDSHEKENTENVRRKRRKRVYDPQRKRACVDCTKRCVRVHGRVASSDKGRPVPALPSFFKIMMGYFSEIMEIPLSFARTIGDLTGSNVYLEDAFGLRWRVRLCLHDGVLSFGHGWKNFVLDHDVSVGEFLVFRQIARSVFTVQIFALSACERMHLCEKNERQSRKRKPRQKKVHPADQKLKVSNNNVAKRRKKQRVEQRNELGPSQCGMLSVHVCIDSGSELRCSESSEKKLDVGSDAKVPTRAADDSTTECNATVKRHPTYNDTGIKILESMVAVGASSNTIDMTGNAKNSEDYARLGLEDGNAETENSKESNMLASAELRTPFAMMDLNEVSIDDIFLSADIYEFDTDFCSPEAFSVPLNTECLASIGQTSGICDSSMGAGHCSAMPETSACLENKQLADAHRTTTDAGSVAVHGIDINALPGKENSAFGQDNSSPYINADAEVAPIECELDACKKNKDPLSKNKDKGILSFTSEFNQVAQKGPVSADSSVKKDVPGQTAAEMLPASPKRCKFPDISKNSVQPGTSCEGQESGSGRYVVLAVAENNKKFCIVVPPSDQTWLELPKRLPVLPRTKKQARKILILKDPCMRLWPVLYQCTPKFNGFIAGWADISRENNLREGDTCEFELCNSSELSFQVSVPNLQ